jgi:phosphonatase-like hydrolase
MSKYKLAVFDLAGTTVKDTNTVGSCLQMALRTVGVEVSVDDVNAVMGQPKPWAIEMLLKQYQTEGDIPTLYAEFRRLMVEFYQTSEEVGEIEGASETFRGLKEKGLLIAVDTGFERDITDVLLKRMQWGSLVDDSITTDEVENGRPAPDMIFELCKRHGVEAHEVIKIGDTPADIAEGKNAKVGLVVGVLYGTHSREQLEPLGADLLIEDIKELLLIDL